MNAKAHQGAGVLENSEMRGGRKLRITLLIGILAIVACGLFPPWVRFGRGIELDAGYRFIAAPPPSEGGGIRLDLPRLLVEWCVVAVFIGTVTLVPGKSACETVEPARPPRIVMVDDEPQVMEMGEFLIRHVCSAARILSFERGTEAWLELERADPDVLITDWNRGGLSGPELLKKLAARKAKFPIIVVSAFAQESHVKEFLDLGLNISLLPKPYQAQQMVAELSRHIALDPEKAKTILQSGA